MDMSPRSFEKLFEEQTRTDAIQIIDTYQKSDKALSQTKLPMKENSDMS